MTNKRRNYKKNLVPIAKFLTLQRKQSNPLILEAKRLAKVKMIINQSLDSQISEHVEVASLNKNTLTLVTDSPVWATRVRYMQNQILSQLRKFTFTKYIHKIYIKVRPMDFYENRNQKRENTLSLSKGSAKKMLQEIDSVKDPALKAALLRLTKHAK